MAETILKRTVPELVKATAVQDNWLIVVHDGTGLKAVKYSDFMKTVANIIAGQTKALAIK